MEERIKELAKQAGLIAPYGSDHEGLTNFDYRQFAKLIVQECINEIAYIGKANEVFGDRTDNGGLNHILWATETAIDKIREHFGVKE